MLRLLVRTVVVVGLALLGHRLGDTIGLVIGAVVATILVTQTEEVIRAVRAGGSASVSGWRWLRVVLYQLSQGAMFRHLVRAGATATVVVLGTWLGHWLAGQLGAVFGAALTAGLAQAANAPLTAAGPQHPGPGAPNQTV